MVGDQAYIVALAWQVQALNASAEALSGVLICFALAQLIFLLLGGVIVDRLPRRAIMLASDIGRALLLLVVAYLGREGLLQIWQLAILAAFNGAVSAFFMPARSSIQPQLVPKADLRAANSLMGMAFQISLVTGPLLGALLVENLLPPAAFAFDVLTFVISALCLVFVRLPAKPASENSTQPGKSGLVAELKAGFVYIQQSVWLWLTIAIFGLVGLVLMGPVQAMVPIMVRENFNGDARAFGLLLSVRAVSAFLATGLIGQIKCLKRRGVLAYLSTALIGLGVAGLGLGGNFGWLWLSLVGISGLGIGGACFDVIWHTVMQELVPSEYLGRVLSLDMLGSFCMIPLGLALAGGLAGVLGAGTILILGGSITAGLALMALSVREIRTLA
jgi:MFS family permease